MCEGRTGNVGVGEDGEMNSNSGSPLSPVGRRWRLPGFMRAYNTTPIVPNTVSGIVSTDCHKMVSACRAAEVETRDHFGSWGDPITRSGLKEDQDICNMRPDAWDPIPALLHQYPDIFRQTENAPVHWPRRSLSNEDQRGCSAGRNMGERLFVCKNLRE